MLAAFVRLAQEDPSPVVRLYLASAATRLPLERRWELLEALVAHSEDRDDHNLPLMYWYAAEPLGGVDAPRALRLAESAQTPHMASFMARRIVLGGGQEGLDAVVERLAGEAPALLRETILEGVVQGLQGRRSVETPARWPEASARLLALGSASIESKVRALSVKFGDARMLAGLRSTALDANEDLEKRREAVESLLSVKDPQLSGVLQSLLEDSALRALAIRGLAGYRDGKTPGAILAVYPDLTLDERKDALATLTSRAPYAHALLDAVAAGRLKSADLGADVVRQMRSLKDPELDKRLAEVWGVVRESAVEKRALIDSYAKMLQSKPKTPPDVALGRAVYARTCATCHELFGVGGAVGPGLTGSNRKDLDYLLHNILDPSAVMAKEYQPYVILTEDGRVLTGLVSAATDDALTVRTATEELVVPRDEIEEMKLSDKSMMPDDQWQKLTEHEIRSLVAYLSGDAQTPILATAETASLLFNGRDLAGWRGDADLWRVEDGQIVGRSSGLERNAFLVSDMLVEDFRLRFKVKLAPNEGNSGVQFRSEVLANGDVRGLQADVGAGWWGKLYEEHGRGLLWDKSGESHVKPGDWNEYEIAAAGPRIRTYINGALCVDMEDEKVARRGVLALQLHAGPAMEVRFKDFVLEVEDRALAQGERRAAE
jgi:putative heme-binding domain-containing protein